VANLVARVRWRDVRYMTVNLLAWLGIFILPTFQALSCQPPLHGGQPQFPWHTLSCTPEVAEVKSDIDFMPQQPIIQQKLRRWGSP
jgi:hypothetical protein